MDINLSTIGLSEKCLDRILESKKIAVSALEKQIPKKPIMCDKQDIRYVHKYQCPNCKGTFTGTGISKYCYHCGQKLDWSSETENARGAE